MSFTPRVLQHLLQTLHSPGALVDLGLAESGEIPKLPDLGRGNERGADKTMLDELGDPSRVGDVGLATRDVVQVPGVE